MNKKIYQIKNLECKYPNSTEPALRVESLDIYEGEVVFIVGPSGVGKSTILETLGLMNNTLLLKPDSKLIFQTNGNRSSEIDLTKMWTKSEVEISSFRRKHLSFIFQNTNLVPTLTVFENVILPALLQGIPKATALTNAKRILGKIAPDINGNVKTNELAGGERQRVAFARAINGSFSILFADEPTGNLDKANANNLVAILMDYLHEDNRTAVIVTHDVELAVNHADKIVFIEKVNHDDSKIRSGKISDKTNYIKNGNEEWVELHSRSEVTKILREKLIKEAKTAIKESNNEAMKKLLIDKLTFNR